MEPSRGGIYRGLASQAEVVLVKVGALGKIREADIGRGLEWILENHKKYQIRVVNISLGGDEVLPLDQSPVDQLAEEVVAAGVVVVAASGNTGCGPSPETLPPANAPNVITVGGYNDFNTLSGDEVGTYCSSFGVTLDGFIKPEIVALAIWIAAPILLDSELLLISTALSPLAVQPDFVLEELARNDNPADVLTDQTLLESWELAQLAGCSSAEEARQRIEGALQDKKIVAPYYRHIDGTSFAAPIVTSVVVQMLQANPTLTPRAIKHLLIDSALRIADAPLLWQGYGMIRAKRAGELAESFDSSLPDRFLAPPRIEKNKIVFLFFGPEYSQVALAGDFNGWNTESHPMTSRGEGVWMAKLTMPPPGRYGYKFLVDGRDWVEDSANGLKDQDGHGGFNSILNLWGKNEG